MVWIDPRNRVPMKTFQCQLCHYLKRHNMRYSDRRVQVLQSLYMHSTPVSIHSLVQRISEEHPNIGYATVARHVHFFKKIGWLQSVGRRYLLTVDADIDE
jgi:Fe2+ or Zn2+ uptake regulation protein